MKKLILLLVLVFACLFTVTACGDDEDQGGNETPVETPTPEITPEPTPAVEIVQTASGVNIEKKEGVYVTTAGINVRSDCSTDAQILTSVNAQTQLTSTGVSDNGWIEVVVEGMTGYVSADFVTAAQ